MDRKMYDKLKKEIERQMLEHNIINVLNFFSAHIEFENEKPSIEDIEHLFNDFMWYNCSLIKGQDIVYIDAFSKHLLVEHYPYSTGLTIQIYTFGGHEYLRN
jgi:hypothetical protein